MAGTIRKIVIGGPRCGKSTFASLSGLPVFCADPVSLVKDPIDGVTYLPEGLTWSEGSEYVAKEWFKMQGPWIIEGVAVVRALRKWKTENSYFPCDEIIYFTQKHPSATRNEGQSAMAKSVYTIWKEIEDHYKSITTFHKW